MNGFDGYSDGYGCGGSGSSSRYCSTFGKKDGEVGNGSSFGVGNGNSYGVHG
jgi:hypothetical protein